MKTVGVHFNLKNILIFDMVDRPLEINIGNSSDCNLIDVLNTQKTMCTNCQYRHLTTFLI